MFLTIVRAVAVLTTEQNKMKKKEGDLALKHKHFIPS